MKQTKNQIPKNLKAIGLYSRTNRSETEIESAVNRLKEVFPNLLENKYYYYFEGYEKRYNISSVNKTPEEEVEEEEEVRSKKKISKQASPVLRTALKDVFKKGLNIYSLTNKLKKQLNWGQEREFPEEVLLAVCEQFHKDFGKIQNNWGWFVRVLQEKTKDHFAQGNIKASEELKNQGVFSIKDILNKK